MKEYLAAQREYLERNLGRFLPRCPSVLRQAMEYSLFAGGKRLRPILALATAQACGGQRELALAPAVSLEMVHTYSLIHDDLPAMDDDDLRRGKPTCHKVFGQGMAILAGDALLTHAFSVINEAAGLEPEKALAITGELACAAGPRGMVAGQALDITGQASTAQQLEDIHNCKTGALLRASVRIGALVAGAECYVLARVTDYAAALGLTYQVVDDILDVTRSSAQLGKNPGSDAKQTKLTYVSLHGLDKARQLANEGTQRAVQALEGLGPRFDLLRDLAQYIGGRDS